MSVLEGSARAEQSRARYPDQTGDVVREGVRIHWEVYGTGAPTIVLLPTWVIVHSRFWKGQIPYLARHCRVVTFDGRGNGRSDRPAGAEAYTPEEFAADTMAVMDATATEHATLAALSCGALWATIFAADHPERVDGVVYICPAVGLAPGHPERGVYPFDEPLDPTKAGRSTTAITGRPTTSTSSSSSSPSASASLTRPSRSRTPSAGRWTRIR